ncbi:hypothetical protein SDC9_186572 [bioreactor metagenome]|uniref:Uncharacterized protein n=1 Tax=bioreactor metagenome TaxID=1076179 RepID=A0A645HKB9_9ZZZZ
MYRNNVRKAGVSGDDQKTAFSLQFVHDPRAGLHFGACRRRLHLRHLVCGGARDRPGLRGERGLFRGRGGDLGDGGKGSAGKARGTGG